MSIPAWRERAACQHTDPTLFDPYPNANRETRLAAHGRIEKAKRVCAGCPVAAECLTDAKVHVDSGVRGGVYLEDGSQAELPGLGGHEPAPCGTWRAYLRHVRRVERLDDACRAVYEARQEKRAIRRAS